MKASITIPDDKARQLLAIAGPETSPDQQINTAIDFYLSRHRDAILQRTAGSWRREGETCQESVARADAELQKIKNEWPE